MLDKETNGEGVDAVMMTKCDLKCLELLMEPFLAAAENAANPAGGGGSAAGGPRNGEGKQGGGGKVEGGLSRNIVVVAVGEEAMAKCVKAQERFQHQCVLDRCEWVCGVWKGWEGMKGICGGEALPSTWYMVRSS